MELLPFLNADKKEAGLDEAGRGCLAGPVVAAAVILNPLKPIEGLNDSKKLSPEERSSLAEIIKTNALAWAVSEVGSDVIDQVNILQATFIAMHKCVDLLSVKPDFLLVDGNRFKPYPNIEHSAIIRGDGKYQSIAAASILAKVHRDALMDALHEEFPIYGWKDNKGYPTPSHRTMVMTKGACKYHRQTFQIINKNLKAPLLFGES